MSDIIRSNLLYTNQTIEEVLLNTHFTLCANNHREIFVQKHNPILDIREVRYEFNIFQQEVPTSKVGDELRQVLDRVINTHYTKISRKQRRADRKEYFWSQSFCLLTTGGTPIEVVRKYIESQGEKQ